MSAPAESLNRAIQEKLLYRRRRLEEALPAAEDSEGLAHLLRDVDAALERMEAGTYGLCEVCHDPVEPERLLADPLLRLCLDHLTPTQQRALEEDLDLASKIQQRLLPDRSLRVSGWEIAYRYESAGVVGGDTCDFIPSPDGALFFALGDVSGKGVAASMLMANLQATFRTLVSVGLPLRQIVERANRIFCESTLPNQYATLLFGRAESSGEVTLCNAGHLPPVLATRGESRFLTGAGLPLGMFCETAYRPHDFRMEPGDTLLLYTDGIPETFGESGEEYGRERLRGLLAGGGPTSPEGLLQACLTDLARFRGGAPRADDLTVLALRRSTGAEAAGGSGAN